MTDAGLLDLVRALCAFREEWNLETLAASVVGPGPEVTVSAKRDGSVWINHDGVGGPLRIPPEAMR